MRKILLKRAMNNQRPALIKKIKKTPEPPEPASDRGGDWSEG
jgi:hypothetical protein